MLPFSFSPPFLCVCACTAFVKFPDLTFFFRFSLLSFLGRGAVHFIRCPQPRICQPGEIFSPSTHTALCPRTAFVPDTCLFASPPAPALPRPAPPSTRAHTPFSHCDSHNPFELPPPPPPSPPPPGGGSGSHVVLLFLAAVQITVIFSLRAMLQWAISPLSVRWPDSPTTAPRRPRFARSVPRCRCPWHWLHARIDRISADLATHRCCLSVTLFLCPLDVLRVLF